MTPKRKAGSRSMQKNPRRLWPVYVFGMCGILACTQLPSLRKGVASPVINDITTDVVDPPAFIKAKIGPIPPSFIDDIIKYYSATVKTLFVPSTEASLDGVFDAALATAQAWPNWEVTATDRVAGVIEGVATTRLMRFKDDWVVRIRRAETDGQPWKVDMRSKSRLGKGDLGANAARIIAYLKSLHAALEAPAAPRVEKKQD